MSRFPLPAHRLACLLLPALLALSACAAWSGGSRPTRMPAIPTEVSNAEWEKDMQRFAAEDASHPPPQHAVLFVGSSSIRMWESLARDFPDATVINRGFGGSEIRDSTWYAPRIVLPYQPATVVLYAGDNDIASGRTPRQLHDDFVAFAELLHRKLPKTRLVYISTKPSPSRAHLLDAQREANALIKAEAARRNFVYVDVFTPMLDANGKPREELFLADRLHMNAAGYALWRELLDPYVN